MPLMELVKPRTSTLLCRRQVRRRCLCPLGGPVSPTAGRRPPGRRGGPPGGARRVRRRGGARAGAAPRQRGRRRAAPHGRDPVRPPPLISGGPGLDRLRDDVTRYVGHALRDDAAMLLISSGPPSPRV